ncbi:MAG: ComEC family competence protein [Candidatus Melainabacteria bacterium]|nr:ComEC family competence protein [Candidatus Melainabacteria bacterium]
MFTSQLALALRWQPRLSQCFSKACLKASLDHALSNFSKATCGPRLMVWASLLSASGAMLANASLSPAWLIVPVLVGLVLVWARRQAKLCWLLPLLPVLFWGYFLWRLPSPDCHDLCHWLARGAVMFRGRIAGVLPAGSSGVTRMQVYPQEMLFPVRSRLSGATVLAVYGGTMPVHDGQIIEVKARLKGPPDKHYPWQFDYGQYLRRRGIFCLTAAPATAVQLVNTSETATTNGLSIANLLSCLSKIIVDVRAHIISFHEKYAGNLEGNLLSSMILGDRAVDLAPSIKESFRDIGLSHVLAASGFNLTLVTGTTFWLSRLLVRSRWAVNAICFLAMVGFVLLAGPSPSVMRASCMCSLLLLSRVLFRTLYAPSALAVALLATLTFDPLTVADIGLQFSYLATAGIICGAHDVGCALSSSVLRGLPRWFSETIAVIVVAQLSVLPLQLAYFWQIGLLFLPANLLAAAVVPLVTVLGFISSATIVLDFTGYVSPVVTLILDGIARYPLKGMLAGATYLSSWDCAKLAPGPPQPLLFIAFYVTFALMIVSLRAKHFRIGCLVAFLGACGGLVWQCPLPYLTLACFPQTVVLVNAQHEAMSIGDARTKQVQRFLGYMGAKVEEETLPWVSVTQQGAFTIVDVKQPKMTLVVVQDTQQPWNVERLPSNCTAVIVSSLSEGHLAQQKRRRLTTMTMVANLEKLIQHCHPSWLIIDDKCVRHQLWRVKKQLEQLHPLHLVFLAGCEVVLVADDISTSNVKLRIQEQQVR